MAARDKERYYWLKLDRNFFKRHDMKILESVPNGKDYELFYLKLMLESVDHEGALRFNEVLPYDDNMLAAITNTNVDTVRSAMTILQQLGMLEVMSDKTIFISQVAEILGSETYMARRLREYRKENAQEPKRLQSGSNEPICNQEIDIDKELDKETDKEKEKECKHSHGEFSNVKLTDKEWERLITEYGQEETGKAIKFLDEYIAEKPYKSKSHYLAIRRWVMEAVKERETKATGKTAQMLNDSYQMFDEWSKQYDEE